MSNVECIWLELILGHKSILVGTYYRPPGQLANDRDEFLDSLSRSVTMAIKLLSSLVILMTDAHLGIHNIMTVNLAYNWLTVNLVSRHGLSQIINEPTRITDQTASLLDLIITDVPNDIIQTGTLSPVGTSDHAVVFCKLT